MYSTVQIQALEHSLLNFWEEIRATRSQDQESWGIVPFSRFVRVTGVLKTVPQERGITNSALYKHFCGIKALSIPRSTVTLHDHRSPITNHRSPITNHRSPITDHQSPITDHRSPITELTDMESGISESREAPFVTSLFQLFALQVASHKNLTGRKVAISRQIF